MKPRHVEREAVTDRNAVTEWTRHFST